MFRLVFYPVLENSLLSAALLIVFGAVIVFLVPRGERLGARGRRVLVVLRMLAFFLLSVAMLRPTIIYTETRRLAASVHLVLDRSESMSIADEAGGKSRYATATEALREAAPVLETMRHAGLDVAVFAFDKTLTPLGIDDRGEITGIAKKPTGPETAIGYALEQILLRSGGKRILGTILLTDGTQRSLPPRDVLPQEAASRYRDAASPIFPVRLGLGGTGDTQDVAVSDLQANDRVFVKNDFLVSASVRVAGYRNRPIPVRLLFEDADGRMQQVATKEILVREEGQHIRVDFSCTPPKTGLFKYTVDVPTQPKELISTNNAMSGFVRVVEGGLNVLYLQGEKRFEHGFIQRALDASADIHVKYLRIPIEEARLQARSLKRETEDVLSDLTGSRVSLVDPYFLPGAYTVYILDDIDSKAFKNEELDALARLVADGAGLIMIGGFHAFGGGGYGETALAAAAPVVMNPLDRQPLDGPPR
ncbi:MAG TPA: hypothetical protein DEB39_01910, partial [Planctomycetaceae bacterium]|nr:hypothetical protein [Planctomycetaceae bacterium]